MKRALSFILLGGLALMMAACGGSQNPGEPKATQASVQLTDSAQGVRTAQIKVPEILRQLHERIGKLELDSLAEITPEMLRERPYSFLMSARFCPQPNRIEHSFEAFSGVVFEAGITTTSRQDVTLEITTELTQGELMICVMEGDQQVESFELASGTASHSVGLAVGSYELLLCGAKAQADLKITIDGADLTIVLDEEAMDEKAAEI